MFKLFKSKYLYFVLIYIALCITASFFIYNVWDWEIGNDHYENSIFRYAPLGTTILIIIFGFLFIFLPKNENHFKKLNRLEQSKKIGFFTFIEVLEFVLLLTLILVIFFVILGTEGNIAPKDVNNVYARSNRFNYSESYINPLFETFKERTWMLEINVELFVWTGLLSWMGWNIIWFLAVLYLFTLQLKAVIINEKRLLILLPFSSLFVLNKKVKKEVSIDKLNSYTFIPF
ncbi:hypothetical protein [Mycoplasma sp. E35C]|uniref:hypothetical protein n=1 Tax=Mycoplasma sp. E35C TaxID=2801918 RepID=UPI001CA43ED2|nr:hypothetical protein [Mycoplasma sp. E35C]QZX49127.1 hypothetical protein JJE79_03690 [Mycoplasma sp. E35C]